MSHALPPELRWPTIGVEQKRAITVPNAQRLPAWTQPYGIDIANPTVERAAIAVRVGHQGRPIE
jgi:hypothetical protein